MYTKCTATSLLAKKERLRSVVAKNLFMAMTHDSTRVGLPIAVTKGCRIGSDWFKSMMPIQGAIFKFRNLESVLSTTHIDSVNVPKVLSHGIPFSHQARVIIVPGTYNYLLQEYGTFNMWYPGRLSPRATSQVVQRTCGGWLAENHGNSL